MKKFILICSIAVLSVTIYFNFNTEKNSSSFLMFENIDALARTESGSGGYAVYYDCSADYSGKSHCYKWMGSPCVCHKQESSFPGRSANCTCR